MRTCARVVLDDLASKKRTHVTVILYDLVIEGPS